MVGLYCCDLNGSGTRSSRYDLGTLFAISTTSETLLLCYLLLVSLLPDLIHVEDIWTRFASARALTRVMSLSSASDGAGSPTPISPSSKVQTAWKAVRSNFKAKTSMPDLKRWLSYPRASEPDSRVEDRHSEDEEQSLFCESLLALMQRTGRFDYLDYSKDSTEQKEEGLEATQKEKYVRRSLKRFSWSR